MLETQQVLGGMASAGTDCAPGDLCLVEALRGGNEAAFVWLLDQYHASMMRLALVYVSSCEVAEEVVQEAWMGVLQGLSRFQMRSSLKTWIFHILTNCAKTRGQRENRSIAFSSLGALGDALTGCGGAEPNVDAARFHDADPWQGHWASFPTSWGNPPEDCVLSDETRVYIKEAIRKLPPNQGAVITLRDIEGWSSQEVCNALGIAETNQRVLLHRARSQVRKAIEQYMDGE